MFAQLRHCSLLLLQSAKITCHSYAQCRDLNNWKDQYETTVDTILLKSNIHICQGGPKVYKRKNNRDLGNSKTIKASYMM